MNIIKPLIGILMLLLIVVLAARQCKKDTGSYRLFLLGSLYGTGGAAFFITAIWLIAS